MDIPQNFSTSNVKSYTSYIMKQKGSPEKDYFLSYSYKDKKFTPVTAKEITCWDKLVAFFCRSTFDLKKVCSKLNKVDFASSTDHTKDEVYALAIRLLAKGVREAKDNPNSKSTQKKLLIAQELLKKVSVQKISLDDTRLSLPAPHNEFYIRHGRTTRGDLKLQYLANFFFKEKADTKAPFTDNNNPLGDAMDTIGLIVFRQKSTTEEEDIPENTQPCDLTVDFTKDITIEGRGNHEYKFF